MIPLYSHKYKHSLRVLHDKPYAEKITAKLPLSCQEWMKNLYYAHQIMNDTFRSGEPEYNLLPSLIKKGDIVFDVGANIGHYTIEFSRLVGTDGRVISLEPVVDVFWILTHNTKHALFKNITLINAAASSSAKLISMSIPEFDTGMLNYYEASIGAATNSSYTLSALSVCLHSLAPEEKVSLIKIDAEGHEFEVLCGCLKLIQRDHPMVIAEGDSQDVTLLMENNGYIRYKCTNSPNFMYCHSEDDRLPALQSLA